MMVKSYSQDASSNMAAVAASAVATSNPTTTASITNVSDLSQPSMTSSVSETIIIADDAGSSNTVTEVAPPPQAAGAGSSLKPPARSPEVARSSAVAQAGSRSRCRHGVDYGGVAPEYALLHRLYLTAPLQQNVLGGWAHWAAFGDALKDAGKGAREVFKLCGGCEKHVARRAQGLAATAKSEAKNVPGTPDRANGYFSAAKTH